MGEIAVKMTILGGKVSGYLKSHHIHLLFILIVACLYLSAIGCYNNNTGETNIGGKIKLTLPAFPESGSHAVEVFTEMHFQPSYRTQEGPRILPPPDSVPVTGAEIKYDTMDEYKQLSMPTESYTYNEPEATHLYDVNCASCHGEDLKGNGPVRKFMKRGPYPADLTAASTLSVSNGELYGFISGGGREGLASRIRGRESSSPMPEFRLLLTEEERWSLVRYLRSK